MKKLIFLLAIVTIYSCNSTSKHKKTTYEVQDWQATVPQNLRTWDAGSGWVKMIIYKDSVQYKEDTASNGDISKHKTVVSDTFYLLRSVDTKLPLNDSTGAQKIDPTTKQPLYYLSWNNPVSVPKDVIHPELHIPTRFLPQLYSFIPPLPRPNPPDTTPQPPTPSKHLTVK